MKKKVTFIEYEYFGIESGFEPKKVFAIKGREHPDPAGRMIMSEDSEGNVISDFNRRFERKGSKTVEVDVSGTHTAHQEQERIVSAFHAHARGRKKMNDVS